MPTDTAPLPAPPSPPPRAPSVGDAPRGGRPTGRVAAIALLGLLTVALVAWGAFGLVELVSRSRTTEGFELAAPDRLEVDTDGPVTVTARADGGTTVLVARRVTRGLQRPDLAVATTTAATGGSTLRLTGSCPAFFGLWCEVAYDVAVPPSTVVVVHADRGGVRVTGITGRVEASSSAGGVRLTDVTGDVDASSSAGSVTATGLRGATVGARSSAGSVRLRFATPPEAVAVRSSAGAVEVVVPRDGTAYKVDASASAGSVDTSQVATDPASSRTITARSSAGSVTVRSE